MLQQTRLSAVAPAYERFLARFPTMRALAKASEDEVLSAWSGLGYYSRARHLLSAARILTRTNEGRFPSTFEQACSLPGVGPYTAAAVLSIAYGKPHAAVDANVRRVLSRWFGLRPEDLGAHKIQRIAEELLPQKEPGNWNEALMELGQKVCLPRQPRCEACPVAALCSYRAGPDRGAVRSARPPHGKPWQTLNATLYLVQDPRGRILLDRGGFPYLDHLWLPPISLSDPNAGLRTACLRPCGVIRHTIVRRKFVVQVFHARVNRSRVPRLLGHLPRAAERRWFSELELSFIGRSALLTKALRLLPPILRESAEHRALVATAFRAGQGRRGVSKGRSEGRRSDEDEEVAGDSMGNRARGEACAAGHRAAP